MGWDDPLMVAIFLTIAILGAAVFFGIVMPWIPTRSIAKMLVGINAPPIFVATVRRLVTAAAVLIFTKIGGWLEVTEPIDPVVIGGVAWAVVEGAWGLLDQSMKPDQNNDNPPRVAGGAPANMANEPSGSGQP